MNKREESKLTAYMDIIEVIDNPGDGTGNEIPTGLNNVKNNLVSVCSEINEQEVLLKNSALGKTRAKDESMEDLIDEAIVTAGVIYAYAVGQGDIELETFANVSERELQKVRETEIPIKVKAILDKADEVGESLETFGITQTERDNLRNKLADFNKKAADQNLGITNKTAARDALDSLFDKADKTVDILEKLMKRFENTQPEFYNRFLAAKNIKNKAVRHKAEEEQETAEQNT